jgi:hypothetical protein
VERKHKASQNSPRFVPPDEEEEEEEREKRKGVKNWREKSKDRRLWNEILKQVKTHKKLWLRLKKKKKKKKERKNRNDLRNWREN